MLTVRFSNLEYWQLPWGQNHTNPYPGRSTPMLIDLTPAFAPDSHGLRNMTNVENQHILAEDIHSQLTVQQHS